MPHLSVYQAKGARGREEDRWRVPCPFRLFPFPERTATPPPYRAQERGRGRGDMPYGRRISRRPNPVRYTNPVRGRCPRRCRDRVGARNSGERLAPAAAISERRWYYSGARAVPAVPNGTTNPRPGVTGSSPRPGWREPAARARTCVSRPGPTATRRRSPGTRHATNGAIAPRFPTCVRTVRALPSPMGGTSATERTDPSQAAGSGCPACRGGTERFGAPNTRSGSCRWRARDAEYDLRVASRRLCRLSEQRRREQTINGKEDR